MDTLTTECGSLVQCANKLIMKPCSTGKTDTDLQHLASFNVINMGMMRNASETALLV